MDEAASDIKRPHGFNVGEVLRVFARRLQELAAHNSEGGRVGRDRDLSPTTRRRVAALLYTQDVQSQRAKEASIASTSRAFTRDCDACRHLHNARGLFTLLSFASSCIS